MTHHRFHRFTPHARALTRRTSYFDIALFYAPVVVGVTVSKQSSVLGTLHSQNERSLQVFFTVAHGQRV